MIKHNALKHIAKGILVAMLVVLIVMTCSMSRADIPGKFIGAFVEIRNSRGQWVTLFGYILPTIGHCLIWKDVSPKSDDTRYSCHYAGLLSSSQ